MRRTKAVCTLTNSLVLLAFLASLCPDARAVPSFTRQTGLACTVCHSNPPELTAFGRKFKLDGYTLTDKAPSTTIDDKDLKLSRYFPIGGMAALSETATNTPQPGAQNWTGRRESYALFGRSNGAPFRRNDPSKLFHSVGSLHPE